MQSDKQKETRKRNWNIRCLRGMYVMANQLPLDISYELKLAIDKAIVAMGGESEGSRTVVRVLERL